jgi:type I restriction enzyme S subunit
MNSPNTNFKHYSIPTFDELGTYKVEKGEDIKSNKFTVEDTDVLVSKLNPHFSRVIYSTHDDNLICSTEFVVWRTSNIEIKNYMYMIARDYSFITFCTKSSAGTSNSHKRVNPTVMMKYKVAYQQRIAERFGSILGSTIKMYAKNQIENKTLSELRDWLLPMLMNGQVRVE